jgi:hypothetical protein
MTKKKEVHKKSSFFFGIREVQKAWETLGPIVQKVFLVMIQFSFVDIYIFCIEYVACFLLVWSSFL